MKLFLLILLVTVHTTLADEWELRIHKIPPGVTIYRKGNWYYYKDASGEYRLASDFRIQRDGHCFQVSAIANLYKTDEERKKLIERAMTLKGVEVVLESKTPQATSMGYTGAVSRLVFKDITEQVKWNEWGKKRGYEVLIVQDIGHYKRLYEPRIIPGITPQHLVPRNQYNSFLYQNYDTPDRTGYVVFAMVMNIARDRQIHEFLRDIVDFRCSIRRKAGSRFLFAEEVIDGGSGELTRYVKWPAQNGAFYSISHWEHLPWEIIDAYLKRFPSILPKNFRFDKVAWVRMEWDLRLAEMRKHLDEVVTDTRKDDFGKHLWELRRYIVVPGGVIVHANPKGPFTVEEKQATIKSLRKWWEKNQSRLVWDKRIQKARVKDSLLKRVLP